MQRNSFKNLARFIGGGFLLAILSVLVAGQARAVDVTWTGGFFGTNVSWRTQTNWDVGVPASSDNAIFGSVGTVTVCSIDMGGAGGTQQVGSITLGSGRSASLSIR